MAIQRLIQANFTAGEWTKKLAGRVDLAKYKNAVRSLINYLINPLGPVVRRSGFRYIASCKTAGDKARLLPFIFSEEQAYILEFGNQYVRFYMNQGQIQTLDGDQKLLLHFNEVDQSVIMDDASSQGNNVDNSTNYANATVGAFTSTARVSSAKIKFGAGALLLDGTQDFLQFAAGNTDFDFSAATGSNEDYGIDCWIYPTAGGTANYTILSHRTDASNYMRLYLTSALSLLIRGDGADGSTTITNDALNSGTITVSGNAQLDTAQKKFGTASILFDGTGDSLYHTYTSIVDFSGLNLFMECWIRINALGSVMGIFSSGDSVNGFSVSVNASGNLELNVVESSAKQTMTGATTLSVDTWYHVRFCADTSKYYLFLDGTQDVTAQTITKNIIDYSIADPGGSFNIGLDNTVSPSKSFNGWIDDIRVSNTCCISTANFTKPTTRGKALRAEFEVNGASFCRASLTTADEMIDFDAWHHVSTDGSGGGICTHTLYVDGVSIGGYNDGGSEIGAYTQELYIGAHHNHTVLQNFFKGYIDELQIKNVAGALLPKTVEYGVVGGITSPLEMSSGATLDYAVPYVKADLPDVQIIQSYDTLYLFHPDYVTRKLTRTSHVAWQMTKVYFNPAPTAVQNYEPAATLSWEDGYVAMQTAAVAEASWTNVGGHLAAAVTSSTDWVTGDRVRMTTTNTLPTGLALATDYWVIKVSATSLKFATSFANALAGTPIAWTDDGTGTHTITENAKTFTANANVFLAGDVGRFIVSGIGRAEIVGIGSATTVNVIVVDAFPTPDSSSATSGNWALKGSPASVIQTQVSGGGARVTMLKGTTYRLVAAVNTFRSDDINKFMQIHEGYVKILTYVNATNVEVKCLKDCTAGVNATDDTQNWTIETEVFSGTDGSASSTGNGYPSCGAFYEERLVLGGVPAFPQTIFGSQTGDYENFAPGPDDSDAYQFTFAGKEANIIKWMEEGKVLIVGTTGGEWRVGSNSLDAPITPSNIFVKKQTSHGSKGIQPVSIGQSVLFVQKEGRKIRELVYSFEQDGYLSPNMAILAEHATVSGIKYMDYQQEPLSTIWCIRDDGTLLGITYLRDEEVVGWQIVTTDGEFESIAVIPGSVVADAADEVWVTVKRNINGSDVRYVELLEQLFDVDSGDTKSNAFFVDAGYSDPDASTLKATVTAAHLAGETVSVLADGVVSTKTADGSGVITLDSSAYVVHVGLPFTSTLQTLSPDSQNAKGTGQGYIRKVLKVTVRVDDTVGLQAGPSASDLKTFRATTADLITTPTDIEIDDWHGGQDDGFITIVEDNPLPSTILAIIAEVDQE